MDALHFDHISFSYGSRHFSLSDISFHLPDSSFVSVLGANGAGKTTLFRLACGVLAPSAGSVRVNGADVASMDRLELARTVAFVPQQPPPAIGMTAEEYVLLGRIPYARGYGFTTDGDLRAMREAMEITDCTAYRAAALAELSGGELQRVLVARALAQQPRILLLDEPNSHLDVAHQLGLFRALQEWRTRTGGTVVASTHDLNLASMFSTHVAVLSAGRLDAFGAPEAVITEALVARVFRVRTQIVNHAYGAAPAVHLLPH